MYEEFYGLAEKPFSIQPDPSFLYWGRGHRLAYAMLEYGVLNHAGISVITGEVGCGKTTLIHRLLDQLSDTHTVALLSNIQQGRGDLLSWVLMGFGQTYTGKTHVERFAELQHYFIGEYAKGRRVVLVIDEAQNLSIDMLEEIRMLSNINAGKDQLLQLILAGQPQLKELLNRPDMLQLAQRVGSDFHLTPLTRDEVHAYIETRLTIAGARRKIFTDTAIDLVAEQSRGVPRVINTICDTALVYGFSAQDNVINEETIRAVVRDKGAYGVFGIASDDHLEMPENQATGPSSFLKDVSDQGHGLASSAPVGGPSLMNAGTTPGVGPSAQSAHQPGAVASVLPVMSGQATALKEAYDPDFGAVDDVVETVSGEVDTVTPQAMEQPVSFQDSSDDDHIEPSVAGKPADHPTPDVDLSQTAVIIAGIDAVNGHDRTIASIPDGVRAFCINVKGRNASPAETSGALQIVEVKDANLSEGRARNAAYRRLKKQMPDVQFVQFLDAGSELDAGWLTKAVQFMGRRPEVAVIDGRTTLAEDQNGLFNAAVFSTIQQEPGEIMTTGPSAFVRADAFEAAGGFRGDIHGIEMDDLCIRLRRRGMHVWRTEIAMGVCRPSLSSVGAWMANRRAAGDAIARGAALHGGAPEHFQRAEQNRAIIWGLIFPVSTLVIAWLAAAVSGFIMVDTKMPVVVAGVLAVAVTLFLLRIIGGAVARGAGSAGNWLYSAVSLVGQVPTAIGILAAWRGKSRSA
ncbi:MAG: AAA family ATPase [Pseudomonadota bacterium]